MTDRARARIKARWLRLSGNSRGALWMLASGLGFSVMAVGIKLLGDRLDSFQIAFFRVVIGFLAILPFLAGAPLAQLKTRHLHVHAVRGVFGLIALVLITSLLMVSAAVALGGRLHVSLPSTSGGDVGGAPATYVQR